MRWPLPQSLYLCFMETTSELNPFIPFTSDYGFKVTFGNEDNTLFLCRALQALIGSERTIVEVVFDKTTFEGITRDGRSGVYDLNCTDDLGNSFIVEMQVIEFPYIMQRMKFYGFQKFNTLVKKGDFDYAALPKIYCIAILANNTSPLTEYHHMGSVKNQHGEEMDAQMKFVNVELKKFAKEAQSCTTDLDKLIFTMKSLSTAQQQPIEYPKFWTEEWLKIALHELDTRAMSPEKRMAYEMVLANNAEAIRQEKAKVAAAKEEGLAEGEAKGEAKGRAEAQVEAAQGFISLGLTDEMIATALKVTNDFVHNIRLDMAKAASAEQEAN